MGPNCRLARRSSSEGQSSAGALTPAEAAHFISLRVSRGWQWTGVYGSDATLALVAIAFVSRSRPGDT